MRATGSRWQDVRERLRRLMQGPVWRRRLIIATVMFAAQAAALGVTYRAVVFHDRTLLTGSVVAGTEANMPPYGYPGPAPQGFNEIDAGASAWQFVPQIRKAHAELASGELPLWSANVMLGAPLAAAVQHGLFNPFTWLLVASPTTGMWDMWLLSRLLMAGLLCSVLAWYLGLRPFSATISGMVYMMSGVFEVRTTTIQTGVMAVLPLLVLAVEYCVRRPSRRSSALLAVAVAATILFGMPEETFLCLLFGAVYFVVRYASEWFHHRRPPGVRVLWAGLGGAMVGLLLGLPLILPLAEYLGLGATTHGAGAVNAIQAEDPQQLLRLVGPHWIGGGPIYQVGFAPFDNWFGVGAILLAFLGVFTRALPRGMRTLLILTAVLVEAKTVGFPGWFNQAVSNLPIISRISVWAYIGVFVSFAVALLAGAGLQRIHDGAVSTRQGVTIGVVLGAAIALAAPAFLTGRAVVVWSEVALTGVILIAVVLGARLAARTEPRPRSVGLLMAAGAVTAELILLATPAVPLPIRYDPLSPTPTTAYLQRVMPSGSGRSYSATQILYPSTSQAYNLDDIRNLDAIYIERTYRYLKLFVDPTLTDRFDGLAPNAANYIHNPFLNALNVEYVLVAPPLSNASQLPADQFTLATVARDGVAIYHNRDATPRAQVIFDVTGATSEQGAATIMSRPGFDPSTSAVVETNRSLPTTRGLAPVPAHIEKYTDSQVVIITTTTRPGTLVLADAYYPGWHAEIDGKSTTIDPVDVALRGVQVPAGTHTVTMQYQPQSVEAGALGVPAGIIVFGVGGWVVPAMRRGRRRLDPSSRPAGR
jgi:hypothetical protein